MRFFSLFLVFSNFILQAATVAFAFYYIALYGFIASPPAFLDFSFLVQPHRCGCGGACTWLRFSGVPDEYRGDRFPGGGDPGRGEIPAGGGGLDGVGDFGSRGTGQGSRASFAGGDDDRPGAFIGAAEGAGTAERSGRAGSPDRGYGTHGVRPYGDSRERCVAGAQLGGWVDEGEIKTVLSRRRQSTSQLKLLGSSEKFVGGFGNRKVSKCMI